MLCHHPKELNNPYDRHRKIGFPDCSASRRRCRSEKRFGAFPFTCSMEIGKNHQKTFRVYAKTNTLTFTNTLKSCIMSVQTEYGRQVKYHCLLLTFVKRLELAEAVLT